MMVDLDFFPQKGRMDVRGKLAMVALVIQNTILVLSMRYSRMRRGSSTDELYTISTAVTVMEFLKLLTCLGVLYAQSPSYAKFVKRLDSEVKNNPKEILKLMVPSLLYMLQNNLLYIALSYLDAATYSVVYQLKILTTALFSVVILGRRLSGLKWLSLGVLTIGVATVEFSAQEPSEKSEEGSNHILGFMAIMAATVTSGFAGVYFEAVLKGARTSLWIRNTQMGLTSVLFAFLHSYIKDGKRISEYGYFFGYDTFVFFVIFVQAIGGLVVAVVVKYADNILKTFASSVSILSSTLLSMAIFGFRPRFVFAIGAVLVILSIFMYGKKATTGKNIYSSSERPGVPKKIPNGFQAVDGGGNTKSLRTIDTQIPV